MKLNRIIFVIVLILAGVAGYIGFKAYVHRVIAKAILSNDDPPAYLPEKVKEKVRKMKAPVNEGATTIINAVHQSKKVTLQQILHAIDNVTEEQAYALLESLNNTRLKNPDQVFDIAKQHFPVDFDVEIFRQPYREKVSMRLIKKGISYGNHFKENQDMDFESARSVVKQILIQKENELDKILND